jgi:hypothetical protein
MLKIKKNFWTDWNTKNVALKATSSLHKYISSHTMSNINMAVVRTSEVEAIVASLDVMTWNVA